jgi:DNA (cytosine-5)-methyltransferase 1
MIIRANAQIGADLFDEIVVDNFAGGGGASMGIETALGRSVDVAINHNAEAIATHRINHPHTRHITSDVWEVDPAEVAAGRRIGLAWFSPDCTFFSKARGGKPIRDPAKKSRALAWVVIRWAALPADVRPRVVILENVEEFQHWGPLDPGSGKPCPKRKGKTFRSWTGKLRGLGYDVQWKELRACDYGAPTIRKRLFLVARCDGLPIVWPPPEYGDVDCQDADAGRNNSVDRRSRDRRGGVCHPRCSRGIDLKPYRTAAECIDWSIPCPSIFERKRPLADNTLKRIARGIQRYVIEAAEPFIVSVNHGDSGGRRTYPMDEPMRTVCASARGGEAICVPSVAPLVMTNTTGHSGAAATDPLPTITTGNHQYLVAAFMARHFGGMTARSLREPAPTTTCRGTQNQLATATMIKLRGTCRDGQDLRQPAPTITSGGTHAGLVAALLVKYYGADQHGQGVNEPLHTIPTRERFGLVTCSIDGELYIITDIGMRMLQPRELFRAQGFPDDYVIDRGLDEDGRIMPMTKTAQVRLCGNSVCPPLAEALARANYTEQIAFGSRTTAKVMLEESEAVAS